LITSLLRLSGSAEVDLGAATAASSEVLDATCVISAGLVRAGLRTHTTLQLWAAACLGFLALNNFW
jgi:hypothetical protein